MSPSISEPQFLLDENVRQELLKFLKSRGVKAKRPPKGISNGLVASLSKESDWVLVTNDSDFALSSSEKLFAVVWLRVAQDDVEGLLNSFASLLAGFKGEFKGKLVVLKKGSWSIFPLGSVEALTR